MVCRSPSGSVGALALGETAIALSDDGERNPGRPLPTSTSYRQSKSSKTKGSRLLCCCVEWCCGSQAEGYP